MTRYEIVDDDTGEVISTLTLDEQGYWDMEEAAGALGYHLRAVGS